MKKSKKKQTGLKRLETGVHPPSKAATSTKESRSKWIPIKEVLPLPSYVKEALEKLNSAGFISLVVGGCVRDFLLGESVKDHDIATNATPDQVIKLFPRALSVGKAFGVIKVPTGTIPPLLEIATFRKDLEYKDHRRPIGVAFTTPEEDALRRDFTINALFYDPKTNQILDCVEGFLDLKNGLIRAIGNPTHRFREDALRLLRGVRFKTRFGFQWDQATFQAIQLKASSIKFVSAERVRDELTALWVGQKPEEALKELSKTGLLKHVLPEIEELKTLENRSLSFRKETLWTSLLKLVQLLSQSSQSRSPPLFWAAILFYVPKSAEVILQRLKMSRSDTERVVEFLEDVILLKDVFQMREATLIRNLRRELIDDLLNLYYAECLATDGNLACFQVWSTRLKLWRESQDQPTQPLLDGKDLIQLGFKPGPEFSQILSQIEDLHLEGKLKSKEQALEYVLTKYVN